MISESSAHTCRLVTWSI